MSYAEIITILICFHFNSCRNFKHYYLGCVKNQWKHLFPRTFFFNRFVEVMPRCFVGKQVVVAVGTNDINHMTSERIEKYIERYLSAIEGLGASRVYLYSLHPRNFSSDRSNVNTEVEGFNNRIRARVSEISSIVYLEVYSDFICEGELNPKLYYDKLHLSPCGYEILVSALKRALMV